MTIAEKLLALSYFAERDPTNLGGLRWRLFTILDDIDRERTAQDMGFIDSLAEDIATDIAGLDPSDRTGAFRND